MPAQIGIVLGSYSDVKRMKAGLDRLTALQVPFEMCIASAHRTPERLIKWLAEAEERGVRVVIAGAGAAAHLPGVVASKTLLPVIGVPFDASSLQGQDALYSIVQMPPGIPVATVGIDAAENAVVLALHILALADPAIRQILEDYRGAWQAKIEEHNAKLYEDYPHAEPGVAAALAGGAPKTGQANPAAPESGGACRVVALDPESPDISIIEEAVDVLLDGGIVALPTDTVYGLAADATNQKAVQRLYQIKDRDPKKAIPVLVDTMKMFSSLATDLPKGVDKLLDRFWPGALTVVASKKPATLKAVSLEETLGLRMPNNMVVLGIISMLCRPLATSSANRSGEEPATTATEVAEEFGDAIDLVLDAGPAPGGAVSTVLSVVEEPFVVLRNGAINSAVLKDTLGDLLA